MLKPNSQLILSLFPGVDLLGMAFEKLGFIVVRGPDIIFGGDIHNFKGICNKFNGIIGGPPCQEHSEARTSGASEFGDLTNEFERVVLECKPDWWIMENVRLAPIPNLRPIYSSMLNSHWFGSKQSRNRRISSNLPLKFKLTKECERYLNPCPCVTATEYKGCASDKRRASRFFGRKMTLEEVALYMDLDQSFYLSSLTIEANYKVLGNGVPLKLGIAIATAVKEYLCSNLLNVTDAH